MLFRSYAGFEKVGALGSSLPTSNRQTTIDRLPPASGWNRSHTDIHLSLIHILFGVFLFSAAHRQHHVLSDVQPAHTGTAFGECRNIRLRHPHAVEEMRAPHRSAAAKLKQPGKAVHTEA